jgi:NADPH:quinone reductase-like Zn-dependent oxidoreductase
MKAIVMYEQGTAEVLRYESITTPHPGAGEVLVRVHATSVNHSDILVRSGKFAMPKSVPHILGREAAGEIAEVGEGVTGWRTGERVTASFRQLGRGRDGAYAQYTTVPAQQLHRIPPGVEDVDAASIGMAFGAAWNALSPLDRLGEGERVVVYGASGGVGTAAVLIAHWKGAQVTAICEGGKGERLRGLGADVVIDRNAPDVVKQVMKATEGRGASVVLDLVGRATLPSSIGMLAKGGRIVCVGTLSGDLAEINVLELIRKCGTIQGSSAEPPKEEYAKILGLFANGTLQPVIDCMFSLEDARAAHQRIEAHQAFGKIVLLPRIDA